VGGLLASLAFGLDEDRRRALQLAAGASRYLDVEDALSEELVEAETRSRRPVDRRVSYPTQRMSYDFTGSLEDVDQFVLTQPGTLLLDLAAGRQMVRAYLAEEPPPRPRAVKRTSVRVYVLDASGSMHGARARLRDAILIAELNAIRVKAAAGLPFDPLYFCFFTDRPTELRRVDSGAEATRHLEQLFRGTAAEGQTDITLALQTAFDSIGQARGRDPYLARATAVLVTDGEDGVDLELVRRLQQPYAGLDIALSLVSLGEENPDLRSLALEQRERGRRAFYHHLSDAEVALAPTEFDSAWRTLYPAEAEPDPEALEALLPHLEALEAVARGRPAPELHGSNAQFDTLFPEERPALVVPASPALEARLGDILDALAEATPLAAAERRAREAVALLTHLLGLYGVPLPRYLEAVGAPALHERARRLRLICRAL
jgi:Mg-chelatase subunit ChlD